MNSILGLFILYVLWRGWDIIFHPPAPKPKKGKCKRCSVEIAAGEEFCYYCEIGEFRIWKRDNKKKS